MARYRICNIEEAVSRLDMSEVPDDTVETDDGIQFVVSGWSIFVESLNLTLRKGIVCSWDDVAGLYMPDTPVSIIYDGEIGPGAPVYYEQVGFAGALADWLNGRLSAGEAGQLWCELNTPANVKKGEEKTYGI